MRSKSVKIVSRGCLGRGPLSSAKKYRKSDPLEPSQEGSLCSDSTIFTFPLCSPKVSKMVAKSSRNGGPMLSKTSPERLPNKCSKHVRFFIDFESQKGGQNRPGMAGRGPGHGGTRPRAWRGGPQGQQVRFLDSNLGSLSSKTRPCKLENTSTDAKLMMSRCTRKEFIST